MKKLVFLLFLLFSTVCHAKLDVVFAIDNNYPPYTMLMIDSIMKNNISKQDYTFWVLETGITPENKKKMADYVQSIGQEIKFITIDSNYIEDWRKLYSTPAQTDLSITHITPIAMARILIPKLLPQDLDKALYLDSDMLVAEDLKNLYDEDLGDYFVGMVEDNLCQRKGYMNAGVILFNLPKWRENDMTKKMLFYLNRHTEEFSCNQGPYWIVRGCYLYKDQDLIHIVLKNKTKELDARWNNQDIKDEKVDISTQKGIYHFIGGGERKPWNSQKSDPQKLWLHYWKEAPFHSEYKIKENQ